MVFSLLHQGQAMAVGRLGLDRANFGDVAVEVPVKVPLHGGLVRTHGAWVRFLPRVSANVPPQVAGVNGLIVAVWAGLRPPPLVWVKVSLELLRTVGLVWAVQAGERCIPTLRLTMGWVLSIVAPSWLSVVGSSSTHRMPAVRRHLWGIAGRSAPRTSHFKGITQSWGKGSKSNLSSLQQTFIPIIMTDVKTQSYLQSELCTSFFNANMSENNELLGTATFICTIEILGKSIGQQWIGSCISLCIIDYQVIFMPSLVFTCIPDKNIHRSTLCTELICWLSYCSWPISFWVFLIFQGKS